MPLDRVPGLVEDLGPAFPPFALTSRELAERVLRGEAERYAELLSVNGHALMLVERRGGEGVLTLYWLPGPLAPEGLGEEARRLVAEEWQLVSRRIIAARRRLEGADQGQEEGLLYYRARASTVEGLARLVGEARRVAGIVPMLEVPPEDVLGGRRDWNELLSPLLEEIITLVAQEWDMFFDIVRSGLYVEIPIRETAESYEQPLATFYRYVKALELYGVVRSCPLYGRGRDVARRRRYYFNLRHEHVLSLYMTLLPLVDPETGPDGVCALLPYLEGASHKHWHIFPGPYEKCRSISTELRREEPTGPWRPPC